MCSPYLIGKYKLGNLNIYNKIDVDKEKYLLFYILFRKWFPF